MARRAGLAPSAIRFYEDAGLIPPPNRSPSGYRVYDPSVIERISFIRAGQAVGLTLAELKEVLAIRDEGEAPCLHVRALIERRIQEVETRIAELRRLRNDLVTLAANASTLDPQDCGDGGICKILDPRLG